METLLQLPRIGLTRAEGQGIGSANLIGLKTMNVSSDPKSLGTGNLYLIALPGNLLRQELPQGTRFSLRTLTVVQISKFYETRLILDPGLFDLAAELEIDILPEPDGLGVFAAEGDPDVDQKAQALAARIGNNYMRLFGFRTVVKVKKMGGGN